MRVGEFERGSVRTAGPCSSSSPASGPGPPNVNFCFEDVGLERSLAKNLSFWECPAAAFVLGKTGMPDASNH